MPWFENVIKLAKINQIYEFIESDSFVTAQLLGVVYPEVLENRICTHKKFTLLRNKC